MKEIKEKFLIWGAKGHAKVLDEIIRLNAGEVVALVDKDFTLVSPINKLNILNGYDGYINWVNEIKSLDGPFNYSAIAAIGGNRGQDRIDYLTMFQADGFKTPSLIHPTSYISDTAVIGKNTHICAFAFVGAGASVGDACIVNTKASIDHESTIADGVHLAPNATLCGCVTVGKNVFIGAGATVLPNLTIGDNSTIGAGSLVTKSVPANVLVYGNPAKIIRNLENA